MRKREADQSVMSHNVCYLQRNGFICKRKGALLFSCHFETYFEILYVLHVVEDISSYLVRNDSGLVLSVLSRSRNGRTKGESNIQKVVKRITADAEAQGF